MVVEALIGLGVSKSSSQLATVNWLKASHYGWVATADEANFKASVAAGIKKVSETRLRIANGRRRVGYGQAGGRAGVRGGGMGGVGVEVEGYFWS